MEHDYQLDTSCVANLMLQPSWIQHLVIERGPVNTERPSVFPVAIATQLNSIVHPFPVPSIIGSHQCDRNTVEFEFPFETRLR